MAIKDQFMPIEAQANRWPITLLHKNQKLFLQEVVAKSFEALCQRYTMDEELYRILTQTTTKELARIRSDPWPCDADDDKSFWEAIAVAIETKIEAKELLKNVIERYVKEICSYFSVRHYECIAKCTHYTFIHLLKPCFFGVGTQRWTLPYKRLEEQFHLMGHKEKIRALAKIGTVVLVPTHTSNWDSVVIGLAMKQLGLPPLTWGAGLNLFNNKGFRYIFNKLGTYKIDRRKKTIPYLQTQKDYACLILRWGCHTLFYPGGTRSRLGVIESDLKLGLLSTPFQGQKHNFQEQGANGKKCFIIPIVLNYHCVLEAHELISQSIEKEDFATTLIKEQGCCQNLLFTKNILLKPSELFINIGEPLDVMGNKVDMMGHSYDDQGQVVDLYKVFCQLSKIAPSKPSDSHIKRLSEKIVAAYYAINTVLSSHLVAFVAYELATKGQKISPSLKGMVLDYSNFALAFEKVYQALWPLYKKNKIDFTPILRNASLETIIQDGLLKLGIYHAQPLLVVKKDGNVSIQDPLTLFYYHNRLTGYGLEAIFRE